MSGIAYQVTKSFQFVNGCFCDFDFISDFLSRIDSFSGVGSLNYNRNYNIVGL